MIEFKARLLPGPPFRIELYQTLAFQITHSVSPPRNSSGLRMPLGHLPGIQPSDQWCNCLPSHQQWGEVKHGRDTGVILAMTITLLPSSPTKNALEGRWSPHSGYGTSTVKPLEMNCHHFGSSTPSFLGLPTVKTGEEARSRWSHCWEEMVLSALASVWPRVQH